MGRSCFFILALTGVLLLGGCLKKSNSAPCVPVPVSEDEPTIVDYLTAHNITGYSRDASGLYYIIDSTGAGVHPTVSSKVYVTYTGKLTNNTAFETVTDPAKTGWVLGTLLKGWQIGLAMIGKGGHIRLFIPSALGYGCQATGPVPANSVLVFDIVLVDMG